MYELVELDVDEHETVEVELADDVLIRFGSLWFVVDDDGLYCVYNVLLSIIVSSCW